MTIPEWTDPLDITRFLTEHWQKSPVIVRGGVADWKLPIDVEGLFGLAAEADVASRLIRLPGVDRGWDLRTGPFLKEELCQLPDSGWTLLVQEIDRRVDGFRNLLERFRFIPNWRIDDVMLSYATPGAGVGAHIDRYDVFLVQAEGRRRWRIGDSPLTEALLRSDTAVPILKEFKHCDELLLEPGDMLYLPPRFAHEGVALDAGFTCSIGFRAPDPRELCAGFLRQLAPDAFEKIRYTDPDLQASNHVGEIPDAARSRLREAARELYDEGTFDLWLGRFVTTPQRKDRPGRRAVPMPPEEIESTLRGGGRLQRSAPSHFAWHRDSVGKVHLFVGGEHYPMGRRAEATAEKICGRELLDLKALEPLLQRARMVGILMDLVARGYLIPQL